MSLIIKDDESNYICGDYVINYVINIGSTEQFQKYLKLKLLMITREELLRKVHELIILKKKDKKITGLTNIRRKIRRITNKFQELL